MSNCSPDRRRHARRATRLALALLATGLSTPAALAGPAEDLLAEMKAACGGAAWDRVAGWHETSRAEMPGGMAIDSEVWHDMHALKSAMVGKAGGQTVRHTGFDGATYWQVQPDGQVRAGSDPARLSQQRRDAYLSSFGWFFPGRFPAAFTLGGMQQYEGQSLRILHIAPEGADAFDLWVDPQTKRVRRIVAGDEYANLSDYKNFGGVCTATTGVQGDGDPAHDMVLHVLDVKTADPIPAATFAPPSP